MFFEIAVLHLFGKFLERHLWQSDFQQNCYLILATMLKKFILWRKLFKEFPESVKYGCYNKEKYEHQKTNQIIQKEQVVFVWIMLIVASVSEFPANQWKAILDLQEWSHTHSKNYKIAIVRVTIFRHCTLKGWKNNGRIHIFGRVHCGTFFNLKNISCMYLPRSKTSTGVQK